MWVVLLLQIASIQWFTYIFKHVSRFREWHCATVWCLTAIGPLNMSWAQLGDLRHESQSSGCMFPPLWINLIAWVIIKFNENAWNIMHGILCRMCYKHIVFKSITDNMSNIIYDIFIYKSTWSTKAFFFWCSWLSLHSLDIYVEYIMSRYHLNWHVGNGVQLFRRRLLHLQ